jgi:scyllo-inositol 2-dehydrogenase (NADP+)
MTESVGELPRPRVLVRASREGRELVAELEQLGVFEVHLSHELGPPGFQVVVAAGARPPSPQETGLVEAHLRSGGGLVLVGAALEAWSRRPDSPAGWTVQERCPLTELRLRPVPKTPIAARLDPELLLCGRLWLGQPPADAEPLVTVPWRFEDRVAGFWRRVGAGRCLGLALEAEHWPAGLLSRLLRLAAGLEPAPPVGVALLGYGAVGREHAEAVEEVEGLELRAVCDRSPARRREAQARHRVAVVERAPDLLQDPSVEVVVVGVPPAAHAPAVLECLQAQRHVVCEKPFALRTEECERMERAAADAGRALTVYQSRRWDPDFVLVRDLVRSGEIGEVFSVETFAGGYGHPCSLWHSHQPISGGTIYDWGSHYLDWILQWLPGPVVNVRALAQKRVWHDVTNADHVRVELGFADGREASFVQSDIAAAAKPKWYLLGTRGAVVADWRHETLSRRAWNGDLIEERLEPAEAPARITVHRPGPGGVSVEVPALPPRSRHGFYRNLADHLLLGEPLAVPAAESRRTVALLEAATRSIAEGGHEQEVRV